jgi:hypothetical protein
LNQPGNLASTMPLMIFAETLAIVIVQEGNFWAAKTSV